MPEEIHFNPETKMWEFTYKGILRFGKSLEEAEFLRGVLEGTYALIGQLDGVLNMIDKELTK